MNGDYDGGPPRARFEPTDHLRLDVADLMSEEEQARDDEPATSLDFTLKRYSSELRAIYRRAAGATGASDPTLSTRPDPRDPTPLSVPGFVRLMRRAGVAGADVTCVQLARAAHASWRDAPVHDRTGDSATRTRTRASREERRLRRERELRRGNVMDPNGSMVYRQFAEACVRVAHVKFNEAFGLDRRAEHLIVEHLLPSELDEALDESRTLPWDAKMEDAEVRESAEAKAETYFREVRGGGGDDDAVDETSLATPTVTGRAFLRWLKSKGALADGDEGGEPVTWPPPEPDPDADPGEDGGERRRRRRRLAGTRDDAQETEEGEQTEEAAEEKAPPPPSLTTLQALAAFYHAIGPVAAAAEEEAAEEEAARARYEAEEAAAATGTEKGEPEEGTPPRGSARIAAEATRLARAVDCEAMFPEFFEALGRCADAAVKTEGASLAEKLATFFAEVVDGTPAVASA